MNAKASILYSSGIWHNFEMYLSLQHPSEVASTNKQLYNFYFQMLRCNEVKRLLFGFAELDCPAEEGAEFVFLSPRTAFWIPRSAVVCHCSSQSHRES